jgi:hypothetical protein
MRFSGRLIFLSMAITLLLQGAIFSSTIQQTEGRKIVFEEIVQFNDGGMAVTVLTAFRWPAI